MYVNSCACIFPGTLRGVRGFDDRVMPLMPSGRPGWYQVLHIDIHALYQIVCQLSITAIYC